MPEFDLYAWKVGKNRLARPLGARCAVTLKVSCTAAVQVRLVQGSEEVPIKTGSEFTIRFKTREAEQLIIEGTKDVEYGYSLELRDLQDGDPINDQDPPAPPMPGNSNLLLQMRNIMRQEMRRSQQPVFDPEDLPGAGRYEIDDEDYYFEEEIGQQRRAERARKRQASQETAPHEAGAPGKPAADEAAPEPAQAGSDPSPPGTESKLAAE